MFQDRAPSATTTVIHRLHPFVKMAVGCGFSILALCLKSPPALAVLLGFLGLTLCMARLRLLPGQWLSILGFLALTSAINFWASRDPNHAAVYSLRFAIFLTAMPVLAVTTDPRDLTRALSRTPLPAGVVMAVLLVWRFFPLMAEEARQMRRASRLRKRPEAKMFARVYRGFVVPMAFLVIEYADRITLALELRGFSPDTGRTCHNPPVPGFRDLGFGTLALVISGSAAWLQWGGMGA